ncbi:MAG: hypothetical protein IJW51_00115 [Clostridia bacterium]|nr:hypothetical protein [Clostridia bacterium]
MFEDIDVKRKPIIVFFFSAAALLLFAGSCAWCATWSGTWYGAVWGLALMVLSIPCYLFGARLQGLLYLVAFLLNTVGMGLGAATYYQVSCEPAAFTALLPALILPLILLLVLAVLLTVMPQHKHPVIAVFVVIELALLVAGVVFWVKQGGEFYACAVFAHLIAAFYTAVYAFTVDEEERSVLRDLAIGSYGAFWLVGLAALIAIACVAGDGCDCDCDGDCCDCSGCEGGSGSSKGTAKRARREVRSHRR